MRHPSLSLHGSLTLAAQVVGDLWERYLRLLDEGVPDGYVTALILSLLVAANTLDISAARRVLEETNGIEAGFDAALRVK